MLHVSLWFESFLWESGWVNIGLGGWVSLWVINHDLDDNYYFIHLNENLNCCAMFSPVVKMHIMSILLVSED